jgi:hypothetical protein
VFCCRFGSSALTELCDDVLSSYVLGSETELSLTVNAQAGGKSRHFFVTFPATGVS